MLVGDKCSNKTLGKLRMNKSKNGRWFDLERFLTSSQLNTHGWPKRRFQLQMWNRSDGKLLCRRHFLRRMWQARSPDHPIDFLKMSKSSTCREPIGYLFYQTTLPKTLITWLWSFLICFFSGRKLKVCGEKQQVPQVPQHGELPSTNKCSLPWQPSDGLATAVAMPPLRVLLGGSQKAWRCGCVRIHIPWIYLCMYIIVGDSNCTWCTCIHLISPFYVS